MLWLRMFGPPILAFLTTLIIDQLIERRGFLPPMFRPGAGGEPHWAAGLRRGAAGLALFVLFWLALFAPLAAIGTEQNLDLASLAWPQLFLVHGLLAITLALWHLCGFVPVPGGARLPGTAAAGQYGLSTPRFAAEAGLGLIAGFAVWMAVLLLLLGVGLVIWAVGGEEALPREPSPVIPWLASLPLLTRLGVSASAGFFEELFFRGFLQPRVGIGLSTALFVMAHASYEQPLMLLGVTILSLIFAYLVKIRQNIWPAVVAHAVFDAIQLTIVIPRALEFLDSSVL